MQVGHCGKCTRMPLLSLVFNLKAVHSRCCGKRPRESAQYFILFFSLMQQRTFNHQLMIFISGDSTLVYKCSFPPRFACQGREQGDGSTVECRTQKLFRFNSFIIKSSRQFRLLGCGRFTEMRNASSVGSHSQNISPKRVHACILSF